MEKKTWHERHLASLTFGDRIADSVANGMGSWKFIIWQTIIVICWMALNVVGFVRHWDVYGKIKNCASVPLCANISHTETQLIVLI
jgi:uncharacterized membrane protein